ncbi:ATP-dependent zinc protease family protein [Algihabitans albus]|uniref:ATP-dependent zinc protease family protein n=1 Tax=Algihabitans albus TaxID=2164067 RepID=UPI002287103B|nr:RimK/LysX family protein [Algihabitans albus]
MVSIGRAKPKKTVVGWREWVAMPELGIEKIKAKIDTGARTSALHAFRIEQFQRGGRRLLRFRVHPLQRLRDPEVLCEAVLIDERVVVSSNGEKEHRYVVETSLKVGGEEWPIEMTLTNRDQMSFRMLLGRQALRQHLLVDPGRSFTLTSGKQRSGKPVSSRSK